MIRDVLNKIEEEHNAQRIIGWCPLPKALDLAMLVFTLRPRVIVETGVYGGKSFFPMALACKELNHGVVHGIDGWNVVDSTEGYVGENLAWWGKLDHEAIFQSFMGNMARLDVSKFCHVHRQNSDAAPVPDVIDIFHSDSQHSEVVLREIERYGKKVRRGGVIVLDDLGWLNGSQCHVGQAVEKLLSSGFIELYRTKTDDGYWGVFQRVR